jgi:V/A-type H+-transporting ATPase subunit C
MKTGERYSREGRDREDYAAACGRIRALEKRLLRRERLDDLSAAADVPAALRLLRRWGWTEKGDEVAGGEWEEHLTESLRKSDDVLRGLDPHPAATATLVLKYDLLNLSAVLKARLLDRPFDQPLHPRGLNGAASLEIMAERMDFFLYPEPLADELASLGELLDGERPGSISGMLAAARHRSLRRLAVGQGSRLFCDYLDHLADVENIRGVLRAIVFPELRHRGEPLYRDGFIDPALLQAAGSDGELIRSLSRTVYGPLLEKCRDSEGRLSPGLLEREADDFLTSLLGPSRYVSLGPEPIWAYWLARETDLKNIRSVLVMLESGTSREEFGNRLRSSYV